MPHTPPLILASGSRYRAELLKRLHLGFSQHRPDIDERQRTGEAPPALALRLAEEKVGAIAAQHPHSIVIGSDQVASLDGQILGKPGTAARAREQLQACSGRTVVFYTGLYVTAPMPPRQSSLVDEFRVKFRPLTPQQIERYVERELPLDCAGSFRMEGLGISLFEKLEGNDPNTLIGLPLIALVGILNQLGIAIP